METPSPGLSRRAPRWLRIALPLCFTRSAHRGTLLPCRRSRESPHVTEHSEGKSPWFTGRKPRSRARTLRKNAST